MKKPDAVTPADEGSKDLFDPVELEILNRYFGLPTSLDRAQLLIDPAEQVEQEDLNPGAAACAFGVRLEEELASECDDPDPALARAVARICLQVVGRRRPVRKGAGALEVLSQAAIEDDWPEHAPYPAQKLFSVDWAMLCWPETYFLVLVPGFDRYVVVKSSEPEGTGGQWLALGWFARGDSIPAKVEAIVSGWWSFMAEHQQERWEHFLTTGLILEEAAQAWADEVWPPYVEEDEEELEEDPDEAAEEEAAEGAE